MNTSDKPTTRIRFLGSTRDNSGRVIHQAGDIIIGELLRRNHDFLLVRARSGHCMYLDTTRTDLYCIEMNNEV
jgi:hypothetical protein